MNPTEEIKQNNKVIAEAINKQEKMNDQISKLIDERNAYKELLLTFKSMFEDSGNDFYLEMINKTLWKNTKS